ncbi:subtilisin-like protein [Russula earlei]|uniref:Subtilisin-like protein n=1 Tax=Russula earlei TaxID=71964 RepID=A0ACC0UE82_9AGAM|nr:subtilisin-like protein [Russula earlei]
MLVSFLQLLAISSLVAAAPSRRANHVVHERRSVEPRNWMKSRRVDPYKVLPLRIGLAQQNLEQLEELLMAISSPDSPSFGQHWSPERVADHFAPSENTISTVTEWLTTEGFRGDRIRVSPSKGWIDVNATVSEIEALLSAEYHVFTHPSGHEQISCESYSLPDHIREHVELIKPTVHFKHRIPDAPALQKRIPDALALQKRGNSTKLGAPSKFNGPKTNGTIVPASNPFPITTCDQFIVPDCLRELYEIDYKPKASEKNTFGIVEFTQQAYLGSDLDIFFSLFSHDQEHKRPELVSIDGGVVQTFNQGFEFNGESDLDLEYAMTLVNPLEIKLLQTGDLIEGAGFDNWLDAVDKSFCTFDGGDVPGEDGIYPDPAPGGFNHPESCGIIKPPHVVSISYGQDEDEVPVAYAKRQCHEYGKLGMMGSSVLYASGDNGVAGFGGFCPGGVQFNPDFPASCPFVTAVGATQMVPGSTVQDPEVACETVIISGGGFSNIFPMPEYQEHAVKKYLHDNPPPYTAAQYSNSGKVRAFPDLSANGANYVTAIDGNLFLVFGTSASAPVVASMIALINDARLSHDKGPIGFLNPLIYKDKFADLFNDITSGSNPGCGTNGFPAAKGWDPVTGVGTPNFTKLLKAWANL